MNKYKEINNFSEFQSETAFSFKRSGQDYEISRCIIRCPISIRWPLDSGKFSDCIFEENVEFLSGSNGTVLFSNVTFKKNASFENCQFKDKVRFYHTVFEEAANFDNTKFYDLADFWASKFYKPIIFYKTDFLGMTVFSRTEFMENVLFTYSLIEKVVIFRGAHFRKGLDLSHSIVNGTFNVFDIKLNDFDSTKNNLSEDEYENLITKNALIPEKNKRETFKLLKSQLQNQGNQIDALKFADLEITTYYNELKRMLLKEHEFKNHIQNYLILKLNSLSNSNGKSWLRGIIFTFVIALIFFYLSLISTEKYCFKFVMFDTTSYKECMKYYFEFLTPTHKVNFLENLGTNPMTYFLDFVGRSFIAYGIYQTIQAFRKFKNT